MPATSFDTLDMPTSLRGARILVVEDEAFIALDLVMAIEDAGAIAVGPAATVAEALELISFDPPDGAILDVNLPDGTVELRASGWHPRTVKEELRANLVARLAAGRPR